MAPKAAGTGGSNKSITDFFNRAPGLSQTWNDMDSDSEEESQNNNSPMGNTDSKMPLGQAEKRDSLLAAMELKRPAASTSISPVKNLSLRFSPQAQRTVMLPMGSVIRTSSLLQGHTSGSSASSKSSSPLSNIPTSTDVPQATQTRVIAKKMTTAGRQYIPGSDDESDDSLQDLDVLLARNRPAVSATRASQTGRSIKRAADTLKNPAATKLHAKERMAQLNSIAQAQLQKEESLKSIEGQLKEMDSASVNTNTGKLELTEELLKNTGGLEQDQEEAKRTIDSLKRIEALQEDITFHFFEEKMAPIKRRPFPRTALTNDAWMRPLKSLDNDKIDNAFKSGYIKRIAKIRPLPVAVQEWMFEEICGDTQDDALVQSYIEVLEVAQDRFPNHLGPNRIRDLFQKLGAKNAVLNSLPIVSEIQEPGKPTRSISPNIRWLVDTVKRLARSLLPSTVEKTIEILVRLSIDESVSQDVSLRILIAQTISDLLCTFDEAFAEQCLSRMICTLFNSVGHPIVRHKVIEGLPVRPARAHHFRRRLAFEFALNRSLPSFEIDKFNNSALFSHVILHIRNHITPRIRKKPNFAEIMALVKVLDIAIDEGFHVPEKEIPLSTISLGVDDQAQPIDPKKDFFKPKHLLKKVEKPDSAFNASVDQLAKEVKNLRDSIVTSGVSEISRLECRAAIERLVERIECCVRTREPPVVVLLDDLLSVK